MDETESTVEGPALDRSRLSVVDERERERLSARAQVVRREPGELVAHYRIERELGRGGAGVVYAAHDEQRGRAVALKLSLEPARDQRKEALRREAELLRSLDHPNLITLYDFGTTPEGVAYLAMELLEGPSLREWLASPRSLAELRDAFGGAGRGLLAAHEHGLVHADFKPDNVMFSEGRAVVLDFGLTHGVGAGAQAERGGTRAYMAPELLWRLSEGSPRSDQFSFCVALWEGLYGERPFAERDVQEGPPPAPADGHAGRVPIALRRALVQGLALDYAARHPSMRPLLDALTPRWRRLFGR